MISESYCKLLLYLKQLISAKNQMSIFICIINLILIFILLITNNIKTTIILLIDYDYHFKKLITDENADALEAFTMSAGMGAIRSIIWPNQHCTW